MDNVKLRAYMRAVKRNFCPAEDEMVSYYQQCLDPNRVEEIRTHLTDCAECERMLEQVRDFFIDEPTPLSTTTIKDDFEKVWNRVTKAQQPPVLASAPSQRSRFKLRYLSIAASFVIVLIGVSLGLWRHQRFQQQQWEGPTLAVQAPLTKVLSEVEARKLVVTTVPPVYPPLARQAKITGTVRFRLTITRDGSVKNLTLLSANWSRRRRRRTSA